MADNKSIFSKVLEWGNARLDQEITKAKTGLPPKKGEKFFYGKALPDDPYNRVVATGFKDQASRIRSERLFSMSVKNTVVSAIILTRQNQIAAFSNPSTSDSKKGWKIRLKNEHREIKDIKKELVLQGYGTAEELDPEDHVDYSKFGVDDKDIIDEHASNAYWKLDQKARQILYAKHQERINHITEFLHKCGSDADRPPEYRAWKFDSYLRAIVRDRLTYAMMSTEVVRSKTKTLAYFYPVDSGTIKYATKNLDQFKDQQHQLFSLDLLYPERYQKIKNREDFKLDPEKLQNDEYFWVQVVRGKVEQAFTQDELKVKMINPTTSIYNNGYGIPELELAFNVVSGHINAEFYNQSYFTQGFSSKGILWIKSAMPRRKLESVRQMWMHTLKGASNSFQTPIFAGVDEVKWIPLTQSHNDIGFESWIRYLIKLLCSIFQIDPHEIGMGFKDEGRGGGISGDNTKEKLAEAKDKGLRPLINDLQNYFNNFLMPDIDPRFELVFTGTDNAEDPLVMAQRMKVEVESFKTINEARAETGLSPLQGCDEIILNSHFMSWYREFSAKAVQEKDRDWHRQVAMMGLKNRMEDEMATHKAIDAQSSDKKTKLGGSGSTLNASPGKANSGHTEAAVKQVKQPSSVREKQKNQMKYAIEGDSKKMKNQNDPARMLGIEKKPDKKSPDMPITKALEIMLKDEEIKDKLTTLLLNMKDDDKT